MPTARCPPSSNARSNGWRKMESEQQFRESLVIAWLETAEGERLPMDSSCSLGRCASNNLVLPGEKVSRKHALIHAEHDDEFWLSDLGSSNGTYLNSRRLSQAARLFNQDQIAIGP